MSSVKPVAFKNKDGLRLIGILHEPAAEIRKTVAVVLLSPGVKMRVAPHGMYKKMAEHYCNLGFPVLRFDFYGLGDAEGEIEMKQLSNIYNTIQLGRYVDDTLVALDWVERNLNINRCVVGGLCGGAITGMLASQQDARAHALLALGIPVALDVGEENWHKYLSQGQLNDLGKGYIKNIFKFKSWLRLLTFQSDFRVLFKSLKQMLIKKKKAEKPKPPVQAQEVQAKEPDNTNPKFAPAFMNMLEHGRAMCHIFSGGDRLAWEFDEKFAQLYADQLERYTGLYEIHLIDKANHVLAHPDWFKEMLDISTDWLNRRFAMDDVDGR